MKPINKQALRNVGIRDAILQKYPWGIYWYKGDPTKEDFREGHFSPEGDILEWVGKDLIPLGKDHD